MFEVSDQELDGLEDRAQGGGPARAYQSIGDDQVPIGPGGVPQPTPSPSPMPTPPGPITGRRFPAASGAGKALVFVTLGMVGGAIAGGAWGAGAGVALAGALRNVARVKECWGSPTETDRSEAGKSATMAFFGLGLAAVLGYQAYKAREA